MNVLSYREGLRLLGRAQEPVPVPEPVRAALPAPGQPPEWTAVLAGGSPWAVDHADALDYLDALPDASVHCCLTSPPFWRLHRR